MAIDIIPAIDLRNGKVVRLLRGDYQHPTTYGVDPVDTAKAFADAGCRWLHIVDLDGARDGRAHNLDIIEKIIRSTSMQVEVGGGIRTEEVMEYLLAIGAQRLILGTRAISDRDWFFAMANDARFKHRLVLGLDARDGRVATHGWTAANQNLPSALEVARGVAKWPLAGIIYTDISRDGTLAGPNVGATQAMLQVIKELPIIHSGGIGSLAHIEALKHLNIAGIIVGRAIYEGTLDLKQAVNALAGGK